MEVHFSPEKEARLQQVATRVGKNTAQVVEEAVDRMLEYDERFIAAVEEGRASARRGDLLEHDEVVERIEQMFRTLCGASITPACVPVDVGEVVGKAVSGGQLEFADGDSAAGFDVDAVAILDQPTGGG